MSMYRSMRDELSRYRKHKSRAGGSGSGVPYQDYRASRRYVTGHSPAGGFGGYPHDSYNADLPQQYHPSVHAPAAQSPEYRMDPAMPSYPIPHHHEPHLPESFEPGEPQFNYQQAREIDRFLLRQTQRDYIEERNLAGTLPMGRLGLDESQDPWDETTGRQADDRLRQFFDQIEALSQLKRSLPPDHPDIVNLHTAVTEALEDPNLIPTLEELGWDGPESKLGPGNPYMNDDFIEPDMPMTLPMDMSSVEALEASLAPDPTSMDGLEQIVEGEMSMMQGFADPMAMENPMATAFDPQADNPFDEINQAMDALYEQPMGSDPFEQAHAIFDEQMQFMDNPLQMPGAFGPMPGF